MFKLAEREKKIIENMRRDKELETLLYIMNGSSPGSRISLQSEFSPSSSFSNGFYSSDDGSSYSAPFEDAAKYQMPQNTQYLNGLWMKSKSPEALVRRNVDEKLVDELGLSESLYGMRIRDEMDGDISTKMRGFGVDPEGFGIPFDDRLLSGNIPWNVDNCGHYEGVGKYVSDFEGVRSSPHRGFSSFGSEVEAGFHGLQGGYKVGDSMGSYLVHNQTNPLLCNPSLCNVQSNYLAEQRKDQENGWYDRGIQLENPQLQNILHTRPCLNDHLVCSPHWGVDSNGGRRVTNTLNFPNLMHQKMALSVDNPLYDKSILQERTRASVKSRVPQSTMSSTGDVEDFNSEDGLIIQGKSVNYVVNKGRDSSKGIKKSAQKEIAVRNGREKICEPSSRANHGGSYENSPRFSSYSGMPMSPNFSSLAEVQGFIYFLAKDQNGCRSLQRVFDDGTCQDVQIIFDEIIGHVVELMMNPFGNYLIQKLLDVCNEEQRLQIVLMVTKEPGQLVNISLNAHGTRVIQKLIETLKMRQQITLVKMALEPGFLDLIKDLNGNHVVQRCLQCLSSEDNKFIFDAAAKFCVDIATHRHGCCVLQRCIAHSTEEHRDKLITEISRHGLLLALDPFGNYVVQYIIELQIPSTMTNLISQFEGNFVHLSMQKFSSHVVEKCLRCFEESRSRIIHELLSVSHFEQLLQDPFANYVIQSALAVTKGPLHASLVEAVRPHTILRTSPYCKRIFSRNLLKK